VKKYLTSIYLWFDSDVDNNNAAGNAIESIVWLRCLPFIVMHLACLMVFMVGISPIAVTICTCSYVVRMFAITGFYHRYFSHRAFKTSRAMQFMFGLLGTTATQRGPLWWTAHHRHHHKHSDETEDRHSPGQHGFLWSHCGWFIDNQNFNTDKKYIRDLTKFPELMFLNRYDVLIPVLYATAMYFLGTQLQTHGWHTSGWQVLIWGYFVATVLLYHATFSTNSIAHMYGKQRFATSDNSRNNIWVAMLTLGEGWHNNHHFWPSSARQGFYIQEIDITYYCLKILEKLGLIWSLRLPPKEILEDYK
jgi:stearoyl-CoA desaturase (delta-9 desaturase)